MLHHAPRSLALALLLTLVAAAPARSQPFGTPASFLVTPGGVGSGPFGFLQVPSSPDLTSGHLTIEMWTRFDVADNYCYTLASKGPASSWWVGYCRGHLTSSLRGYASVREGGTIPVDGLPHHVAVTYDGDLRKHYVDGELVGVWHDAGGVGGGNHPIRFLWDDDADAGAPIGGFLFEVRLWNVARTQAQVRQTITQAITTRQPGLVAVWPLRFGGDDVVGNHQGGLPEAGASFAQLPQFDCPPGTGDACLLGRFAVKVAKQQYGPRQPDGHRELVSDGRATVVPGASGASAIFWFFDASNWELLVKAVNGCGLNSRFWVYSAATTDQHYMIWLQDRATLTFKAYLNYAGAPAPAVTDSSAFATCP